MPNHSLQGPGLLPAFTRPNCL